ncbi:unnamed protein product [Adineta steineri]|uniref:Uncharacterized protein n=1 Tax=Adineta steineri TaxID=433720 RepID=A0A819JIV1_9BILA|nr:unnamed protein product [Adineta steineri]
MKSTTVAQQSGDTNATQKVKRTICVPSFLTKYTYQSEFIWYFIGVIIRIIWTLIYPQQGYIHPDEFFQGPEVVFGMY